MEDTLREAMRKIAHYKEGLNPCFNGRYSQSAFIIAIDIHIVVLILVLMEDTLRVLRQYAEVQMPCLNPCFNGRYSQSLQRRRR